MNEGGSRRFGGSRKKKRDTRDRRAWGAVGKNRAAQGRRWGGREEQAQPTRKEDLRGVGKEQAQPRRKEDLRDGGKEQEQPTGKEELRDGGKRPTKQKRK